jgi:hypothetical protein
MLPAAFWLGTLIYPGTASAASTASSPGDKAETDGWEASPCVAPSASFSLLLATSGPDVRGVFDSRWGRNHSGICW